MIFVIFEETGIILVRPQFFTEGSKILGLSTEK